MKKCKCGGTPVYVQTHDTHRDYAQVVCTKCEAKGIKQAGINPRCARAAALLCWDAGEREVPHASI
jgi:hypothetical protein